MSRIGKNFKESAIFGQPACSVLYPGLASLLVKIERSLCWTASRSHAHQLPSGKAPPAVLGHMGRADGVGWQAGPEPHPRVVDR